MLSPEKNPDNRIAGCVEFRHMLLKAANGPVMHPTIALTNLTRSWREDRDFVVHFISVKVNF